MDPAMLTMMGGAPPGAPPMMGASMGAPPMPPGGETPAQIAMMIAMGMAPVQAQEQDALKSQQTQTVMMALAQAMQGQGNPVGAAAGSEPMLPPQDGSMIDPTQDPTMGGV